jgi:hypothetical protein
MEENTVPGFLLPTVWGRRIHLTSLLCSSFFICKMRQDDSEKCYKALTTMTIWDYYDSHWHIEVSNCLVESDRNSTQLSLNHKKAEVVGCHDQGRGRTRIELAWRQLETKKNVFRQFHLLMSLFFSMLASFFLAGSWHSPLVEEPAYTAALSSLPSRP